MKTVQGMTREQYIKEHCTELRLRWEDMDAQEKTELRQQRAILARQLMRPTCATKPEPTMGVFDKQSVMDWMAERGSVCTSIEMAERFGITPKSAGCRLGIMKREGLLQIVGGIRVSNRLRNPVFKVVS